MSDKKDKIFNIDMESLKASRDKDYKNVDFCIERFKFTEPDINPHVKNVILCEILDTMKRIISTEQLMCALENHLEVLKNTERD